MQYSLRAIRVNKGETQEEAAKATQAPAESAAPAEENAASTEESSATDAPKAE